MYSDERRKKANNISCCVTPDLVKNRNPCSANIAKSIGQLIGGGGGGKPHLATTGGKDINELKVN